MNRTTTGMVLLAFAAVLPAGCDRLMVGHGATAKMPQHSHREPSLFVDPAGFRIDVPPGWHVVNRTADNGLIRADFTRDKDMGVQIRLIRLHSGSFQDLIEQAVSAYRNEMSRHWGGSVLETERGVLDDPHGAVNVRFKATRPDHAAWYLQQSLVRRGALVLVCQGGCPWSRRQEGAAALDRLVASIDFPAPDGGAPGRRRGRQQPGSAD